jgi:hypothetical protein
VRGERDSCGRTSCTLAQISLEGRNERSERGEKSFRAFVDPLSKKERERMFLPSSSPSLAECLYDSNGMGDESERERKKKKVSGRRGMA